MKRFILCDISDRIKEYAREMRWVEGRDFSRLSRLDQIHSCRNGEIMVISPCRNAPEGIFMLALSRGFKVDWVKRGVHNGKI